MESLESYRFPGCSLLLIFDGAAWERLDEQNVNEDNVEDLTRWLNVDNLVSIKMVDFAKGKIPAVFRFYLYFQQLILAFFMTKYTLVLIRVTCTVLTT